jgi:hypothetical protein
MMPWRGGVEQDYLEVPSMALQQVCDLVVLVTDTNRSRSLTSTSLIEDMQTQTPSSDQPLFFLVLFLFIVVRHTHMCVSHSYIPLPCAHFSLFLFPSLQNFLIIQVLISNVPCPAHLSHGPVFHTDVSFHSHIFTCRDSSSPLAWS